MYFEGIISGQENVCGIFLNKGIIFFYYQAGSIRCEVDDYGDYFDQGFRGL